VLVVAVMWTTLGSNAPSTDGNVDKSKITTENLCKAVGGTWNASNTPKCG